MPAAHKGTLTGNPAPAAWQAGHGYTAGAIVQPTSPTGQYFQCQGNGTSAGSEPLWYTPLPVPGTTYPDNTTQWFCMGSFVAADGSAGPSIVVDLPIDTDSATTPVIVRALKNLANYINAFVALFHNWTATQTFTGTAAASIIASPASGNNKGGIFTGSGNAAGIKTTGGATAGYGIDAYGGAGQAGGQFTGGADSYALVAIGGSGTGGQGIIAQGTGNNEAGNFTGGGTGEGIVAVGGSGGAVGAILTGTGGFVGVSATSDTGDGLYAQGSTSSGNGNGVTAVSGGTGTALHGDGGTTGRGLIALSSASALPAATCQNTGSGPGLVAESVSGPSLVVNGNTTRGMIAATSPQGSDPSTPVEGDMYYNNSTHTWRFYNGSIWGTV